VGRILLHFVARSFVCLFVLWTILYFCLSVCLSVCMFVRSFGTIVYVLLYKRHNEHFLSKRNLLWSFYKWTHFLTTYVHTYVPTCRSECRTKAQNQKIYQREVYIHTHLQKLFCLCEGSQNTSVFISLRLSLYNIAF
jgi:hypothetical protein